MPFTAPEQFLLLAVALLGGWLIGYASAPSARKWRRRLRERSASFARYHDDAEDRIRTANRRVADLSARTDARIDDRAKVERTAAVPDPADTGATQEHAAAVFPTTPAPTAAEPAPIGPAEPAIPVEGGFTGNARDDLTRIRGIDDALDTRLSDLGVVRFDDIVKLSDEDEMALEQRLALPVGYVAARQWRPQAALLGAGRDIEHALHFGRARQPALPPG